MKSRQPKPAAVNVDAVLPQLCAQIRSLGALRWAELTRLGVPGQQHTEAAQRLLDAGFETTRTWVRVPLAEQLQTTLIERGQVQIKGLPHLLRGCTTKELVQPIEQLLTAGTAVRVLRSKTEWLMQATADVLSPDQLVTVNRAVTEWAKQTQKARGARKRTLAIWRPDLRDLAETLLMLSQSEATTTSNRLDTLRQLVREQVNPSIELAFVPDVVKQLKLPLLQAHALLLEATRDGQLELRPDSGTSRFTEAELLAAPRGPDGSRLLWVRLCEVAS